MHALPAFASGMRWNVVMQLQNVATVYYSHLSTDEPTWIFMIWIFQSSAIYKMVPRYFVVIWDSHCGKSCWQFGVCVLSVTRSPQQVRVHFTRHSETGREPAISKKIKQLSLIRNIFQVVLDFRIPRCWRIEGGIMFHNSRSRGLRSAPVLSCGAIPHSWEAVLSSWILLALFDRRRPGRLSWIKRKPWLMIKWVAKAFC